MSIQIGAFFPTNGTANPKVSLEDQLLEPGMPLSRGKRVVLGIHQHVDGM